LLFIRGYVHHNQIERIDVDSLEADNQLFEAFGLVSKDHHVGIPNIQFILPFYQKIETLRV
jgi:hypothetical protein